MRNELISVSENDFVLNHHVSSFFFNSKSFSFSNLTSLFVQDLVNRQKKKKLEHSLFEHCNSKAVLDQ